MWHTKSVRHFSNCGLQCGTQKACATSATVVYNTKRNLGFKCGTQKACATLAATVGYRFTVQGRRETGGIEPPVAAVRGKSGIEISKNGQYSFRSTLDLTGKVGHHFCASQSVSHHRRFYFFVDTRSGACTVLQVVIMGAGDYCSITEKDERGRERDSFFCVVVWMILRSEFSCGCQKKGKK